MSRIDVIRADLIAGHFKLTLHARERMSERGVSVLDIQVCARDGELFQDGSEFKLLGLDKDDQELSVVCAYSKGTLIVTVK